MAQTEPIPRPIRKRAPDPGAASGGSGACRSRIGVGLLGVEAVLALIGGVSNPSEMDEETCLPRPSHDLKVAPMYQVEIHFATAGAGLFVSSLSPLFPSP